MDMNFPIKEFPTEKFPIDQTDAEIISLIAEGRTNKEISETVYLACQSVRNRVSRLFDATGTANRTQLAVWWLTGGSAWWSAGGGALPVQPAEQHGHGARVVAQAVSGP